MRVTVPQTAGAAGALASLLALLAANGTAVLDCVCRRLALTTYGGRAILQSGLTVGERGVWESYCTSKAPYELLEGCEVLEQPSATVSAVAGLVPWYWSVRLPPSGEQLFFDYPPPEELRPWPSGERDCGGALPALRSFSYLDTLALPCRVADHCIRACSAEGLNGTEWSVETLKSEDLRHKILYQLVYATQHIMKAISGRKLCLDDHLLNSLTSHYGDSGRWSETTKTAFYLEQLSYHRRHESPLLSLAVSHLSRLFVPLAFEQMGDHANDERLRGWVKNLERLRNMLDTKLSGYIHDVLFISEQIATYKVEVDENRPGNYTTRRPLLSEALMRYRRAFLSFREDYSQLCERHLPNASRVFGLADALYSFYHHNFLHGEVVPTENYNITDEEWELEDKSNATISVDTGCVQLLADTLDHPRCPLEDLPPETLEERRRCRQQLWEDLEQRPPHMPVTSYLAYTQRASVSLCLLAWMAANSLSICQDVPFSIIQSVHDARCYFDSPDNQTCLECNATDAICCVSRVILLLKCRDFSSFKPPETCALYVYSNGVYTVTGNATWTDGAYKGYRKPTERILNYKLSLNSATLKYKDFKVDSLQPLEYSFIVVNIIFRFFTAVVYMYVPHLRNLPGKILLSFQLTGMAQVLCSEVLYRMAGFPSLSSAVLIDSALTLLSCVWLNSFCYQMYAYVRHLRLPNDLPPTVASRIFCRQMVYVLIPFSIVCIICTSLEKSSKYFLIHSRIIFLLAIALSITSNLVFLGLIGYIYHSNKKSMKRLQIYNNDKYFSKKQVIFLTVKTVILSGIYVIIRIGLHQAEGIAQYVYFVHIASMLQGPVLFVFFVCNGTAFPALKKKILAWWNPDFIGPGQDECSAAGRNRERRRNKQPANVESHL